MKVLVTGANGQLGYDVIKRLNAPAVVIGGGFGKNQRFAEQKRSGNGN